MISHAAATDIPIAHPITPPKLAAIRKSHEMDLVTHVSRIDKVNLLYPACQQECSVDL